MPTSLRFLKMQATGNDFLIAIADRSPVPPKDQRAETARRFCDRRLGFGADGFLVIEDGGWDFYNSDGSSANMCGNAARAVGLLLLDQSQTKATTVSFRTAVGTVHATRVKNDIEVRFPLPAAAPLQPLPEYRAVIVNTGVPHAVVEVEDIHDKDTLRKLGLAIKSQFPEGMNVTYFSSRGPHAVSSTTFERGVEEFTLSCGTGALAAARVQLKGQAGECEVIVPGGNLHVTFKSGEAILRGPAEYIGWCFPSPDGEW